MFKGRRTILGAILAWVAVLGGLAAGCQPAEEPAPAPGPGSGMGGPGGPGGRGGRGPGKPLAENASAGEIYQQKCQFCHGANGEGGSGPALASAAGGADADLRKIIHDGRGKMPAFAEQLTDPQIKKVAAHVKQLAGGKG